MPYEHLFFDLDHTLWDFDHNSRAAWLQLYDAYQFREKGIPDFDTFIDVYEAHNNRMWERFRKGEIKREELRWKRVALALLEYRIHDDALAHELSDAYLDVLPTQKTLTPYAREILDYCHEKYQLHLITNGFEETQRLKLSHSGIAHYFKEMVTSEKSMSMKPHRNIFRYALMQAGAKREHSLMIGDALEIDILGAMNAGWDAVYYNPSKTPHYRRPTYEIAHFEELRELV